MQTQTFVWKKAGVLLAKLEIRHIKCEMLLNVDTTVAEQIRAEMVELNNEGLYPNEETTKIGGASAQFIISGSYNWNARWRDFCTTITNLLHINDVEYTEPQR